MDNVIPIIVLLVVLIDKVNICLVVYIILGGLCELPKRPLISVK